jgi:hypothetical protein
VWGVDGKQGTRLGCPTGAKGRHRTEIGFSGTTNISLMLFISLNDAFPLRSKNKL